MLNYHELYRNIPWWPSHVLIFGFENVPSTRNSRKIEPVSWRLTEPTPTRVGIFGPEDSIINRLSTSINELMIRQEKIAPEIITVIITRQPNYWRRLLGNNTPHVYIPEANNPNSTKFPCTANQVILTITHLPDKDYPFPEATVTPQTLARLQKRRIRHLEIVNTR